MQRQRVPPSGFYYTNNIGRTFIRAIEGAIGKDGLSDLLRAYGMENYIDNYPPDNFERAFDFADMSTLSAGLDDLGVSQGDPMLSNKVGRSTFKEGLRMFGGMAGTGIVSMGFRTVSQNSRIKMGLLVMAAVYNTFTDQQTQVEDHDDHFAYVIKRCPLCMGRHADTAICQAAIGLLQEGLHWMTDREYRVEETTCRAQGHEACTLLVYKDSNG